MRLKLNGRAVVCLCLMAIAAAAFINATHWPMAARLFPMVVSGPLFFLALAEFAFNVFGGTEKNKAGAGGHKKKDGGTDPEVVRKQTLWIFGWCLFFFIMVLLFGFPITIPLFVFLYLKPYSKEGWGISVTLTIFAGACFYGLFVRLLNVHFEQGLVQQWLRAMGVT